MADTDNWHEPRDWTAGEVVTETHMDEQIKDNLNFLRENSVAYGVADHCHADRAKGG